MINVFIFVVIVRNDKNVSIKIFKNFRFDRIFEIDFSNAFYIDKINKNVRDLTLKQFKISHKND